MKSMDTTRKLALARRRALPRHVRGVDPDPRTQDSAGPPRRLDPRARQRQGRDPRLPHRLRLRASPASAPPSCCIRSSGASARTSAIGFITTRSLEAAILVVGAISLLSVVTLRNNFVGGDTASLMTTSRSLVAQHDWSFLFGPGLMPAFNAHVPRHRDVPLPSGPPRHPADGTRRRAAVVRLHLCDDVRRARRRPRRPRCSPRCRSQRGSSRSACT